MLAAVQNGNGWLEIHLTFESTAHKFQSCRGPTTVCFSTICGVNWRISSLRNVLWVSPVTKNKGINPKLINFIT